MSVASDKKKLKFLYLGEIRERGNVALLLLTGDRWMDEGNVANVSTGIGYGVEQVKFFPRKVRRYFGLVGGIYEVEGTDTAITGSTARFIGIWPNQTQRAGIQGIAATSERKREGALRITKLEKEGSLLTTLDAARSAYARAHGIHRAHLLAAFVEYIVK